MARIKYYYDTEKCKYERVNVKPGEVILSILGFLGLTFIFAVVLTFLYYRFFPSPSEMLLSAENKTLRHDVGNMRKQVDGMLAKMDELEKRDIEVYRVITEADAPPQLQAPKSNIDYLSLMGDLESCRLLIAEKIDKIEFLRNKMTSQDASYNELLERAQEKEKLLASTPAIQPISNKELTRLASGFGMRIHPILKVRRMHKGIDFSAPKGTPIYATGDGAIEFTKTSYGGYGRQVMVNHGFGYKTRYAHMQNIIVKKGQKVKRGEQIGTVGNTGASTGPHVHYEVIKNGRVVNPVYYFFKDVNDEEFETILERASVENQSLS